MCNKEQENQHMEQPKKEDKKTISGFRAFKKSLMNADGTFNNELFQSRQKEVNKWKEWINEEYQKADKSVEKLEEELEKANAKFLKAVNNKKSLLNTEEYQKADKSIEKAYEEMQKADAKYLKAFDDFELLVKAVLFLYEHNIRL